MAQAQPPATSNSASEDDDGSPLLAASATVGGRLNQPLVGRPTLHVGLLTAFSGIAGFLFGYDTGNISGALPYIQEELLSGYKKDNLHWVEGAIVSFAVYGAAIGSAVGGVLSDRYGRVAALKLADAFFTCGAVVMAAATGAPVLIAGRLLVGFGVGLASVTAPVYIAETAPAGIRASLVTFNTLMITTGQFAAYLFAYAFTFAPGTWRWMLGVAALPAVLQAVGMSFLPESPRWLLARGRADDARAALARLRRPEQVEDEMREVAEAAAGLRVLQQRGLKALDTPAGRLELSVGAGLQMLQQFSGINTVMYYLVSILSLAGITDNRTALLIAMGPAAVNAVGTVLGMVYIDRIGRRKLLFSSIVGVIVALLLLGTAFRLSETRTPPAAHSSCPAPGVLTCADCTQHGCAFCAADNAPATAAGACVAANESCTAALPRSRRFDGACPSRFLGPVLAGVIIYLAAFSPGLGPVPWSVNAEIFPDEVRGRANSITTTVNWFVNATVSQLFLSLADVLGASGVFWLLAAFAGLGGAWAYFYLPETKGLTLDEIQELFAQRAAGGKHAPASSETAEE